MQLCAQCNTNNRDTAHHCAQCGYGLQHLLGAGTILQGRYQIEHVLGTGGFGAVYLVRHLALGHLFALKTSFDTTPAAVHQFEREAKFLVTLQHPNLARVTDFFIEANGAPYLVMEYVEGENLDDLVMRTGVQPVPRVISWMDQTLDALHYLHTRTPAIVHRDIKPGNLILQADGRLVLVDFGIAKESGTKTTIGAQGCSPGFSPPEQYGTQSTDARSDLYSVGATMFFLLTAQAPPDAIDRMVHGASLILPGTLPPRTAQIITSALALSPAQRPNSAREFKAALTAHAAPTLPAAQPSAVLIPPTIRVSPPSRQRLKWRILLRAGLGITVVLLFFMQVVGGSSSPTTATMPIHVNCDPSFQSCPGLSSPTTATLMPTPGAATDTLQVMGPTIVVLASPTLVAISPTMIATRPVVVDPPTSTSAPSPTAARDTPTPIIASPTAPRTSTPSPTIDSTPPPVGDCNVHNDGRLWCNNVVPALIRSEPRNDAPSINILRTKYSWFKCWTMGDQHEGGNSVWYYTVGDDNHNWGYVSAYGLATSVDPPPNFRSHGC